MKNIDYYDLVAEVDSKTFDENPIFESISLDHPFIEFEERFKSLHRYWRICKHYIYDYLHEMNNAAEVLPDKLKGVKAYVDKSSDDYIELSDWTGELVDSMEEMAYIDAEYMPIQIRLSVITFALSMMEHLLGQLGAMLHKKYGNPPNDYEPKDIPYIEKYLNMISIGFGLGIKRDAKLNSSIDLVRIVRNKFLHELQADLPDKIQKSISDLFGSDNINENKVTDTFVDQALEVISFLAKRIENAYMRHFNIEIANINYTKLHECGE